MRQKTLWKISLGMITAIALTLSSYYFHSLHPTTITQESAVFAQTPNPGETPLISLYPSVPPEETDVVIPIPETPPLPVAELSANPLPLTEESYEDPANRFQIGILEGYQVNSVGGSPLIESPSGNLAYTVVVEPISQQKLLNEATLYSMAVDVFRQGEGFSPKFLLTVPSGGILIPWTGTLTMGRNSQPISGMILARQSPENVLLLLISATEEQVNEVESALVALIDTLQPR